MTKCKYVKDLTISEAYKGGFYKITDASDYSLVHTVKDLRLAQVFVRVGRQRNFSFLESKASTNAEGSATTSDRTGNVAVARLMCHRIGTDTPYLPCWIRRIEVSE
ncbi:hypothetical protein Tco_0806033 [Tanacetum coccineum]